MPEPAVAQMRRADRTDLDRGVGVAEGSCLIQLRFDFSVRPLPPWSTKGGGERRDESSSIFDATTFSPLTNGDLLTQRLNRPAVGIVLLIWMDGVGPAMDELR